MRVHIKNTLTIIFWGKKAINLRVAYDGCNEGTVRRVTLFSLALISPFSCPLLMWSSRINKTWFCSQGLSYFMKYSKSAYLPAVPGLPPLSNRGDILFLWKKKRTKVISSSWDCTANCNIGSYPLTIRPICFWPFFANILQGFCIVIIPVLSKWYILFGVKLNWL